MWKQAWDLRLLSLISSLLKMENQVPKANSHNSQVICYLFCFRHLFSRNPGIQQNGVASFRFPLSFIPNPPPVFTNQDSLEENRRLSIEFLSSTIHVPHSLVCVPDLSGPIVAEFKYPCTHADLLLTPLSEVWRVFGFVSGSLFLRIYLAESLFSWFSLWETEIQKK